MFREAIRNAQRYTNPVVVSFRREDGTTGSLIGTYIIINEDGWLLTAFHIVDSIISIHKEAFAHNEFLSQKNQIDIDEELTVTQRKFKEQAIGNLTGNSITNYSVWWGRDNWRVETFHYDNASDIAIGKICDFDKDCVAAYPQFKNPTINFEVGESLIKLGFAFHNIIPVFDEENGKFKLPPDAIPIPFFPIEGIFTRTLITKQDTLTAKFVETSSPGLRGQSGGPTFDSEGRVWAMQSRTGHYDLGFSAKSPNQGEAGQQFLNCGLGTHAETIIKFIESRNISIDVSED